MVLLGRNNATINAHVKTQNQAKHRVWHTDPWPDPTWPISLTRWPVTRRLGSISDSRTTIAERTSAEVIAAGEIRRHVLEVYNAHEVRRTAAVQTAMFHRRGAATGFSTIFRDHITLPFVVVIVHIVAEVCVTYCDRFWPILILTWYRLRMRRMGKYIYKQIHMHATLYTWTYNAQHSEA